MTRKYSTKQRQRRHNRQQAFTRIKREQAVRDRAYGRETRQENSSDQHSNPQE